jgi:hypothetical protein
MVRSYFELVSLALRERLPEPILSGFIHLLRIHYLDVGVGAISIPHTPHPHYSTDIFFFGYIFRSYFFRSFDTMLDEHLENI